MTRPRGINARSWFYSQSFISSANEQSRKPPNPTPPDYPGDQGDESDSAVLITGIKFAGESSQALIGHGSNEPPFCAIDSPAKQYGGKAITGIEALVESAFQFSRFHLLRVIPGDPTKPAHDCVDNLNRELVCFICGSKRVPADAY